MELETAGGMKFVYLANHWPGSFGNFADDKNPGVFSARVLGKLSCEMFYMAVNYVADSDGTAGPLGSVPGMWNHLQGDQVN